LRNPHIKSLSLLWFKPLAIVLKPILVLLRSFFATDRLVVLFVAINKRVIAASLFIVRHLMSLSAGYERTGANKLKNLFTLFLQHRINSPN